MGVKAGGCSGFEYVFEWEQAPREDDLIFDGPNGVRVWIDPRSHRLLDGTTLDYDTSLMSRGFMFQNPQAKSTCGCGTSFHVGPGPTGISMSTPTETVEQLATREYKYGFETTLDTDTFAPGLSEDVVRRLSAIKQEPAWLLEFRLKAYRAWLQMKEPTWHNLKIRPIDYQAISYYSAPKKKPELKSLDEVDPEVRKTFERLGIPLEEQKLLAGVAVDAVFDSVSVATTFRSKLAELGIIFCSFSEAVKDHPELVQQVSRVGGAVHGQLLRVAQLRGLQRRLVRLRAEGRAVPDGALDLLPHQRAEHGPVRADADRRRRRIVR